MEWVVAACLAGWCIWREREHARERRALLDRLAGTRLTSADPKRPPLRKKTDVELAELERKRKDGP